MSNYTSEDDNDLLQSDDTPSVNSLTRPLLKACSDSGSSTENLKPSRQEIKQSGLFEENNRKISKICVMISVVCERAAFYGLVCNLAYFANVVLWLPSNVSVAITLGFSGMTWFGCFLGGIFGDSMFGRFRTISFGLVCYIFGYASITLLAFQFKKYTGTEPKHKNPLYTVWLLVSLLIVSFGEGCFKANMSPFGADQIEKSRNTELRTFFNFFYWSINIGAIIGYSSLAYIQQRYDFAIGYVIPCSLLGLALLIFLIPRRKSHYHVISPTHIAMKIIRILRNAARCNRY